MISIENMDLKTSELRTLTVPTLEGYVQDYDWIYYKYKVVFKVECEDGTFFVLVKDDREQSDALLEMR